MALQEKIELARRELLDLSLRNPLLNYRTLKKKGLDITDEKSLEIYRLLVEEGKSMAFLSEESQVQMPGKKKNSEEKPQNLADAAQTTQPIGVASNENIDMNTAIASQSTSNVDSISSDQNHPNAAIDNKIAAPIDISTSENIGQNASIAAQITSPTGTATSEDIDQNAAIDAQTAQYLELLNKTYSDLKIQTRYNEKDLQDRLLNTHLTAKTFIEERGVNTLFLALGMLIWEEKTNPGKQYRAPLVLVPVTLSRSNARERFLLTYSEEDIQLNVSLAAKLMSDHHITLNTDTEDLYLSEYYKHVREAVVSQETWRVAEDEMAMGFFSFGKYMMYLDLDSTRWPTDSQFFNNEILQSLLETGFHEKESEITDTAYIDPYLMPQSTYQVVDADSSQTLAILDINAGRNLVIQGPPGTGKSQTITNIIAESVARGKKVLFVSEKLAALEVVKRRLTNVGLGDVCLELHSQKANKKQLLAELQTTMELGVPKLNEMESKFNEYIKLRGELTGYCINVNEPVPPSGLSPINLYGKLIRLAKRIEKIGLQLTAIKIPGIETLNDIDYESKALKVKELQKHIKKIGVPKNHPWYGSSLNIILPAKKEAVQAKVNLCLSSLENFLFVLEEVRALLHIQADKTADVQKAVATLKLLLNKPDIAGFITTSPRWLREAQDITRLVCDGNRMKQIFAGNQSLIMDEIYGQDVLQPRQALAANQGKFLKFLSADFNKASRFVDGYLRTPQKLPIDKKVALLDEVLEFNRLRQRKHEIYNLVDYINPKLGSI